LADLIVSQLCDDAEMPATIGFVDVEDICLYTSLCGPDSVGEQRFVTLGLSGSGNLLVVVYSWRGPGTIRLISAWKANARQRKQYAQDAG
jgi:uncharacterized DUF497 family protein